MDFLKLDKTETDTKSQTLKRVIQSYLVIIRRTFNISGKIILGDIGKVSKKADIYLTRPMSRRWGSNIKIDRRYIFLFANLFPMT